MILSLASQELYSNYIINYMYVKCVFSLCTCTVVAAHYGGPAHGLN